MNKILKKGKNAVWIGIAVVIASGLIYLTGPTNAEAQTQLQQIRDIAIEGLDYNTEIYRGSEVAFQAYIKDDPSFELIRWSTNQIGIIELSGQGKQATLKSIQPGQVEIAACVDDDSWSCIHRNIMVRDYPTDSYSQQWLIPGMRAIKQVGINQKNLYVEVAPGQTSEQQQVVLKQYLQQLASLGNVELQTTEQFQSRYRFFTFKVANRAETVTIRVDHNQSGFQQQETILNHYSDYLQPSLPPVNSGTSNDEPPAVGQPSEGIPNPESSVPTQTGGANMTTNQGANAHVESKKEPVTLRPELTLGFSELVQLSDAEQDGSQRYPFRIRFREQFPLEQQQQLFNEYIAKWAENAKITLSSQQQIDGQIVYLFEIFEKTSEKTFYLEFIVDYENGESLPVISPLHLPSERDDEKVIATTSEKISETVTTTPQEDEQQLALLAMLFVQILGGMYIWRWYHQRQSTNHSGGKGGCDDVNHRTM